jgi:hypothetical protein
MRLYYELHHVPLDKKHDNHQIWVLGAVNSATAVFYDATLQAA